MNLKKTIYNLIYVTSLVVCLTGVVYASQYGEPEIINKRFEIDKDVRVEGDDTWKDLVDNVGKDDVIEFRIKIKNKSDETDKIDFDNMRMKDYLPDEMYRVGGSGLTEYWDDFAPGETKTFIIKAKIDKSEFDRDKDFEKCVVNKAKVEWDGEFEGSDTATVCYGEAELKELPETGFISTLSIYGIGMIGLGILLKKTRKYAK